MCGLGPASRVNPAPMKLKCLSALQARNARVWARSARRSALAFNHSAPPVVLSSLKNTA